MRIDWIHILGKFGEVMFGNTNAIFMILFLDIGHFRPAQTKRFENQKSYYLRISYRDYITIELTSKISPNN